MALVGEVKQVSALMRGEMHKVLVAVAELQAAKEVKGVIGDEDMARFREKVEQSAKAMEVQEEALHALIEGQGAEVKADQVQAEVKQQQPQQPQQQPQQQQPQQPPQPK